MWRRSMLKLGNLVLTRLVFNRRKCNPDLTLDGDLLEVVPNFKYLGIWFTSNGSWKFHKQTVLAKARRRAYVMLGFGVTSLLSVKTCVNLWETLVRPVLEYGAEVWGGGAWEEAEKLQREVRQADPGRSNSH